MSEKPDERRPPWRRLLAEGPAAVRLLAAQLRRARPVGEGAPGGGKGERGDVDGGGADGVPVMVLPAFLANDLPTGLLRRTLAASGFRAYRWAQGINAGARRGKFDRLLRRIDIIHAETGRALVLIGWSLGGLYARELAKRRPDKVQLVVTLGTPFSQGLRRNNAWKLYEAVNDHDVDHPPVPVRPGEKPPVHTIACWSPRDGIVAPASAGGADGEADERVELGCRHNEMVSDPEALRTIVALLRRHAA